MARTIGEHDEEMPLLPRGHRGRGDRLPALQPRSDSWAAYDAGDDDSDDLRADGECKGVPILRRGNPRRGHQVQALRKHAHGGGTAAGRDDKGSKRGLPFAPVAGASPTSAGLFFLVAAVVIVLSIFLMGPVGPGIVVLGTSIWVALDASTHKLAQYQNGIGGPVGACLGSLLLWIIVFPWYLAIRSRIRAGVQPLKA